MQDVIKFKKNNSGAKSLNNHNLGEGHVVVQLVRALHYKAEGLWFDS